VLLGFRAVREDVVRGHAGFELQDHPGEEDILHTLKHAKVSLERRIPTPGRLNSVSLHDLQPVVNGDLVQEHSTTVYLEPLALQFAFDEVVRSANKETLGWHGDTYSLK
jgi:hypothetical protein